ERQRPVVNVMQELAGKAAGVQVQQSNGAPGQDFQVLIRGFNSLSGNATPVYVVDGIVGYNIATLDVNNIASITILKDASATGIYGVAGSANGVVQITTKKGVAGQARIDGDFSQSIQSVTKKLDVLNGVQLHQLQIDEFTNAGRASDTAGIRLPANWQNINNNWQNMLFRTAPITRASIRVSGGDSKGGNYALNLGYLNQQGIMSGRSPTTCRVEPRVPPVTAAVAQAPLQELPLPFRPTPPSKIPPPVSTRSTTATDKPYRTPSVNCMAPRT